MKRIIIVEDEALIALNITRILEQEGYEVIGKAMTAQRTLLMTGLNQADLVIIDITLNGEKDGIWLAREIKEKYNIAVIFITGHSDRMTQKNAMKAKPDGYINKPFTETELISAVEIALSRPLTPIDEDVLLCKNGKNLERIPVNSIYYIKSDSNYLNIVTSQKKHYIRGGIQEYLEKLKKYNFVRTHKSYLVPLVKVEKVTTNQILLKNKIWLPLSRRMKKNLVSKLVESGRDAF